MAKPMLRLMALYFFLPSPFATSQNLRSSHFDPKTVMEKCIPDMSVPFLSQYDEDTIVFSSFYKANPKCGGVVLEMGGLDGKLFSNSWFFQYGLKWKALLVEALPDNFAKMTVHRPDAINVFGAICKGKSVTFQPAKLTATGGIMSEMSQHHTEHFVEPSAPTIEVPCKLLSDVFKENMINHVDVFFLDVEGGELVVLESYDWSVPIDILVIEMDGTNLPKEKSIRALLNAKGYISPVSMLVECRKRRTQCMPSEIFVMKDVWEQLSVKSSI